MGVFLSIDIGGSSLRAGLTRDDGTCLAETGVPAPAAIEDGTRSEIQPEGWWQGCLDACAVLARDHADAFAHVSAIAVCGMTRTQIFLDRNGRPLRPAISWRDTRAASDLETMADDIAAMDHGEAAQINAYHPAARLLWLKRHEPAIFETVHAVVDPKDYLNLRLTGETASDGISLQRLAQAAEDHGGTSLLDRLGLNGGVLPRLLPTDGVVGRVSKGLPAPFDQLAGIPVATGGNDTYAAVLGLGALRAGMAYNISGTTEVFGMIGESAATADGLLSVDWGPNLNQLGGPSQTGADLVRWLHPLFGGGEKAFNQFTDRIEHLDPAKRTAQPMLFLPFLSGERTPYWDPDLRGGFVGATRTHGPDDFLWAALEGISLLNAVVLNKAETAFARPAQAIRFGGGGARSQRWAQIKADVTNRTVETGAVDEPGILGGAILAARAVGAFDGLTAAQSAMVRIGQTFEPNPKRQKTYKAMRALFEQLHEAVRPVSKALTTLQWCDEDD